MTEMKPTTENGKQKQLPEQVPLILTDKMLEADFDEVFKDYPLTQETSCGFGYFRGKLMQKFANKKAFVFFYGIAGSIFGATYAYFNGTITTIEKRYRIPSRNSGIISIGNDISSLLISAVLSYYAGKGHRPRWIAFGLFTIVLFCLFSALPHILYGPGEQALSLTREYGANENTEMTFEVLELEKQKTLCRLNVTAGIAECEETEGNLMPQALLFIGQMIAGVGQSLYYTLGAAYIDDNVKKSKTPALISLSYFLRLLGPAGGYALASFCLKLYISPELTPTIDNTDPRWLGAWWLGWLILAVILFSFSFIMCCFPKELPRAAVRRRIASERRKRGMKSLEKEKEPEEIPASLSDMMVTFKRLVTNTIFMLNNIAGVFYYFGYMPYWIFTPKYIETQYKQSASVSSMVTGSVALVFSAIGVLSSGIVISKYKPKARYLAMWNVFVGALSVFGMISYAFLGCVENENSVVANMATPDRLAPACNTDCHCDYVKYAPVCANGKSYISACHAGCTTSRLENNTKIFENCACIANQTQTIDDFFLPASITGQPTTLSSFDDAISTVKNFFTGGSATGGTCQINCQREFYIFLAVMCFIKFSGASGRASNFLVSVRCVEERDKTVAMGFGLMFACFFAFIPSPIFFGALLDRTCLVWGKTCGGKGNCWLYDSVVLRYWMNFIAAGCVTVGVLFDGAVWYYVKDLKIFDEEVKDKELEIADKEDELQIEKPMS